MRGGVFDVSVAWKNAGVWYTGIEVLIRLYFAAKIVFLPGMLIVVCYYSWIIKCKRCSFKIRKMAIILVFVIIGRGTVTEP